MDAEYPLELGMLPALYQKSDTDIFLASGGNIDEVCIRHGLQVNASEFIREDFLLGERMWYMLHTERVIREA